MSRVTAAALIGAIALLVAPARGQLHPASAERYMAVFLEYSEPCPDVADEIQEFDFADFAGAVSVQQSCGDTAAQATYSLISHIAPSRVVVSGSGNSAVVRGIEGPTLDRRCGGIELFLFTFDLDQSREVQIAGAISTEYSRPADTGTDFVVHRLGEEPTFSVYLGNAGPSESQRFDQRVLLTPGRYEILVFSVVYLHRADGPIAANSATRFSVLLDATPCGGDVDGNDVVDLHDLTTLLAHFGVANSSVAEGDLDFDGVVGLADLLQLLAAFGDTCG